MTESYEVYVGNLLTSVLKQELEDLFSEVGDIVSIWINPKHKQITYAFIGFGDFNTANEACKRFDNHELNFCKIKVKMSFKTVKIATNGKSILLDLPKKKGCSKSHLLKKILVQNLRQNPEIVEDFKMACQEAENLTCSNQGEMIKVNAEQCDLSILKETIIRNFKMPRQKKPISVDFDLTKEKRLTTEQSDKWFNLQLPTPCVVQQQQQQQQQQPQQPQAVKKKIPFELDYRSVCE